MVADPVPPEFLAGCGKVLIRIEPSSALPAGLLLTFEDGSCLLCSYAQMAEAVPILPDAEFHRLRHAFLHSMLDELIADFVLRTRRHISLTSVQDFMIWASQQAQNPTGSYDASQDPPAPRVAVQPLQRPGSPTLVRLGRSTTNQGRS